MPPQLAMVSACCHSYGFRFLMAVTPVRLGVTLLMVAVSSFTVTLLTQIERKTLQSLPMTPAFCHFCTRDAIALVPCAGSPRCTEFLGVNGTVEGPIHHVIGREDDYRLDVSIRILTFLAIGYELLVVVGAIDIQSPIVLQSCGVGTEDVGTNRIVVTRSLVVGGQCLCV